MPNFKPKTNKKILIDKKSIITVDIKHQNILKDIESDEQKLPKLETDKTILKRNLYNKALINDK